MSFALNVSVQGIIDRKLPLKALFIRETHSGESLRNRAQADTLVATLSWPFTSAARHCVGSREVGNLSPQYKVPTLLRRLRRQNSRWKACAPS